MRHEKQPRVVSTDTGTLRDAMQTLFDDAIAQAMAESNGTARDSWGAPFHRKAN